MKQKPKKLEVKDLSADSIIVLANKVKSERKAIGLSQTELAQLAKVSLNFLSQLESGKKTIRLDKVLQVLNTLGLELKIQYGKSGIKE